MTSQMRTALAGTDQEGGFAAVHGRGHGWDTSSCNVTDVEGMVAVCSLRHQPRVHPPPGASDAHRTTPPHRLQQQAHRVSECAHRPDASGVRRRTHLVAGGVGWGGKKEFHHKQALNPRRRTEEAGRAAASPGPRVRSVTACLRMVCSHTDCPFNSAALSVFWPMLDRCWRLM